METYSITRMYQGEKANELIETGLTLEEAQDHCGDDETSSSTCVEQYNIDHTNKYGAWFDGYNEE